jgi:hypothetical protein
MKSILKTLFAAMYGIPAAAAFSVAPTTLPTAVASGTSSSTAVYLRPAEGKQLAAASVCIYSTMPSDVDEDILTRSSSSSSSASCKNTRLQSARAFVSRLFHMPSAIWHHAEEECEEKFELFPVVGFRVVMDSPNHCTYLPTSSVNPVCHLHSNHVKNNEQVYGWWSPVCRLEYDDNENKNSITNYALLRP